MMAPKRVQMPERSEMLRRLEAVSNDSTMIERLYPPLLQHAGQMKDGGGIVIMFSLAIEQYARDTGDPAATKRVTMPYFRRFVNAMTSDQHALKDAEDMMKELGI